MSELIMSRVEKMNVHTYKYKYIYTVYMYIASHFSLVWPHVFFFGHVMTIIFFGKRETAKTAARWQNTKVLGPKHPKLTRCLH